MKNYRKLKQIIQEANPEIMENISTPFKIKNGNWRYAWTDDEGISMWSKKEFKTKELAREHAIKNGYFDLRTIRLADILLVLNLTNPTCPIRLWDDGLIVIGDIDEGHTFWNLKYDNLDNQTNKTKKFLIELLVKKND